MRGTTYNDYSLRYGGSQVRDLKKWQRTGTGF